MHQSDSQFAGAARWVPRSQQDLTWERESPHLANRDLWFTRILLACGILAPLITVTLVATMAARTQGYSHVSDTVSDLAAQGVPDAGYVMACIVTVGLLIDAFAYGLGRVIAPGGAIVWATFSVFGTAGALSGLAQDYSETPGAPRNLEGFLHNTFAIIAVIALISTMVFVAWVAMWMPGWHRMTKWSLVAAAGVSISGLIFLVAPESIQGLVQRSIYFFEITWIVLTALTALRTTFTPAGDRGGSPGSSA